FFKDLTTVKISQTSGMDLLTAHRLMMGTENGLKKYVRDFSGVKEVADRFVQWDNDELLDKEEIEVEVALPKKKEKQAWRDVRRKQPLKAAERAFEVNAHSLIMYTMILKIPKKSLK
ncbi:Uncharacterized protein FKW44_008880, partial [Caligus rogercresseyi]